MKIKTWLLLSYFIVMVLPLIAAYFLFAWINSFNDEQKVEEHVEVVAELEEMRQVLANPTLYAQKADLQDVEKLDSRKRSIALLNKDGITLYSSDPSIVPRTSLGRKQLYENLYSLQQGYRSYSYREPVFNENELVGFFQVNISRDEWVTGVENRGYWVGGLFLVVFILIYLMVVLLVNKKLTRRLTGLMDDMNMFAAGKKIVKKQTNQDEMGQLMTQFYEMKDQINQSRQVIEQEQQAKEYLIANISHDLKTPLTSIKAYAESLNYTTLSNKEREDYQQVIIDKAGFMQHMLDDLLTFTLLQSPTENMERVEVEGDEFFDMLVSDYGPLCAQKNITLHTEVNVDGTYLVNPKQMMRVADNLMSNAIQHTSADHKIWLVALSSEKVPPEWLFDFINITGDDEDNAAYFIVQNEGKGIPDDQQPYVFNPIYQADKARTKQNKNGSGLGLSIAKQIIEKHAGSIYLYSKENIGTCVICQIPKKENEHVEA